MTQYSNMTLHHYVYTIYKDPPKWKPWHRYDLYPFHDSNSFIKLITDKKLLNNLLFYNSSIKNKSLNQLLVELSDIPNDVQELLKTKHAVIQ